MLVLPLIVLIAQAAPATPAAGTTPIPGLKLSVIERCEPKSINDAVNCIGQSADEDALDDLDKAAGKPFRAGYEALLTSKWRLADAGSPVAQELQRRKVYNPRVAASILIADYQGRQRSRRLDYVRLAKQMTAEGANAPRAAAPPPPAPIKPGALPLERCKQPTDAADLTITACEQRADGTISRTVSRPTGGAAGTVAPLALPEGIAAGSVEIPLAECKSNTPLPAGVMLKACYRLPDGRVARVAAPIKP